MRSITHTSPFRDQVLHIETQGAIVNITIGLTDAHGNRVTRVDVTADSTPDADGYMWDVVDSRVIRRAEPGTDADPYSDPDDEIQVSGVATHQLVTTPDDKYPHLVTGACSCGQWRFAGSAQEFVVRNRYTEHRRNN